MFIAARYRAEMNRASRANGRIRPRVTLLLFKNGLKPLARQQQLIYSAGMRPVTSESFGLLIAFVIPGLIALWGLSNLVPELRQWIGTSEAECQTFGGFLNLTVASVGAGLTASTVRWMVIDPVHHWTGVRPAAWKMDDFHARTEGLQVLIESHYRYYQFYANCLMAMVFAAFAYWLAEGFDWGELVVTIALLALFFVGSRDTLSKYYRQVEGLLKTS